MLCTMIIIHNKYIPFGKKYGAINLFGTIFTKRHLSAIDLNHEYIHTLQQRELLFVGFYLLYVLEWFVKFLVYRDSHKAYHCISFEREAYGNECNKNYSKQRKFYAWSKYLIKRH